MIYLCFVGEILELNKSSIKFKVLPDGEEVWAKLEVNTILDLKIGDQGIWSGEMKGGIIFVKKIELRKLLDPFYQRELLNQSSILKIVPLTDSPFNDIFTNYFMQSELDKIDEVSPDPILKENK